MILEDGNLRLKYMSQDQCSLRSQNQWMRTLEGETVLLPDKYLTIQAEVFVETVELKL